MAAAERVDPQRHQHLDRAEHHRGHGDERRRALRTGRLSIVATTSRRPWRSGTRASGRREAAKASARVMTSTEPKTELGPDRGRHRAERRAQQGAGDRGAQRRADHRAAALLRRGGDQPGQRPGPDQRPGDALDEAGRVEQDDLVDEAEDEAGDAEQQQAGR